MRADHHDDDWVADKGVAVVIFFTKIIVLKVAATELRRTNRRLLATALVGTE